jgi:hypothetical protein
VAVGALAHRIIDRPISKRFNPRGFVFITFSLFVRTFIKSPDENPVLVTPDA